MRPILLKSLDDCDVFEVDFEGQERSEDWLTHVEFDLATDQIEKHFYTIGVAKVCNQVNRLDDEV